MRTFACPAASLAALLSPETLILSLSFSAEQFTGYAAQELVGRPIAGILADSSAFQLPRILDTAKQWGYWDGPIEYRARDGSLLKAHGMVSQLTSNGNNAAGFLMVSNLYQSPVLDESARSPMAEVAANLRAFAHDLNNPLAILVGFTQLLAANENSRCHIREDIERLDSELKRVVQIVGKLHEYALSLNESQKPNQVTAAAAKNSPGMPAQSLWD